MRYTPFDVALNDVRGSHLAELRDVAEGWYVEYKSELSKPRDLAKSLASFANRHGGWLFIGIQENSADNTADSFPGIPDCVVAAVLEQIRNAAKDLVQPTVEYRQHVVSGPCHDISLPSGRSVIVVRIPEGAITPYIHSDGRMYIRTGDSSSPVPANDRATIDYLYRRAEANKKTLNSFVYRSPEVSEGENETTFLHLAVSSDPFKVLGHWFGGTFTEFSREMTKPFFTFDNIYTAQNGFIARQSNGNNRRNRLFTWEFSRSCDSFVTLPIQSFEVPSLFAIERMQELGVWSTFQYGEDFISRLASDNLGYSRVLHLAILAGVINGIVARHRSLAALAGIHGPFFLKARLENVWRVVPFLDTAEFMEHIDSFDIPVVQDSDIEAPWGGWPEGYITISEDPDHSEIQPINIDNGAVASWVAIMEALGIPGSFMANNAGELAELSNREAERQRIRSSNIGRQAR